MSTPTRFTPLAAAACAAALVVSGAGIASAQGSLEEAGSSAVPIFDSPSTAAIEAQGDGVYTATYTNRSAEDLACAGFVLPADVAADLYTELKTMDFSEIGTGGGDGEEHEPTPVDEALNDAMEAGHVGIMLGDDGIGIRDYMRMRLIAQFEEEGVEYTEEEVEEYLDQAMSYVGGLDEVFGGQDVVNFVDRGATATWSAAMRVALPEDEEAGGIVVCFNGVDGDLEVAETTYVEIEHAEEGGAGDLPSGIFGSVERIFGS